MKEKTIYALGFFDGVHLGHQALLQTCKALATEYGCRSGVVTFSGHPDTLVLGSTPALINTESDRQHLLTAYGMETVVTLPFDEKLMKMPWQDFFRLLVDTFSAAGLVVGEDFRFGHKGEGSAAKLKDACVAENIPCVIVPQRKRGGTVISSTHIRSLLEQGDVTGAAAFLGHPHILTETVVPGKKLGRTIGIPTANLHLPEGVLVPKFGVYACRAVIDGKKYPAVTNIGTRPTVNGSGVTVEPWILDFDGDLYGKRITLEFYAFLRPERKFDSLEELKAEIHRNAEQTRKICKKV